MPTTLTEDEIDDLMYFARTGDADLNKTLDEISQRQSSTVGDILIAAKDSETGNGPLHMAAANGHADLLATVIKALSGASPQNPTQLSILNSKNAAGNTPLHWAALNGHLECVKVLLDAGGDPTITNNAGHDPVYEAELNDKTEVVEWVLKEGEGLEEGIGNEDETDETVDGNGEAVASDVEGVQNGLQNLQTGDKSA